MIARRGPEPRFHGSRHGRTRRGVSTPTETHHGKEPDTWPSRTHNALRVTFTVKRADNDRFIIACDPLRE